MEESFVFAITCPHTHVRRGTRVCQACDARVSSSVSRPRVSSTVSHPSRGSVDRSRYTTLRDSDMTHDCERKLFVHWDCNHVIDIHVCCRHPMYCYNYTKGAQQTQQQRNVRAKRVHVKRGSKFLLELLLSTRVKGRKGKEAQAG